MTDGGSGDQPELFSTAVTGNAVSPVLSVSGEVDDYTAPRFWAALEDVLMTGPAELVVDVTALQFLSSTGLNALVKAAERLEKPSELILRGASPSVHKLIEISGLAGYFTFEGPRRQD